MCGLVGIFSRNNNNIDKELLINMRDEIAHRGPDSCGVYIDKNIGLGFRRLSIIDLSCNSDQPIFNENKLIVLVCNGEIYNYVELKKDLKSKGHVFRSSGDTETLLHAYEEWGKDIIEKFRGMFAFALWDIKREKLFLGRDRLGEKPLFYYQTKDYIYFASEMKSILKIKDINVKINRKEILRFIG